MVCWWRQVYRAETDTVGLQSKQTPVPVAAPRRISNTGLPDEQRYDGRIRTIPSQSAHHVQQEIEDTTSSLRTMMLLSKSAVHTVVLECRLDRPVELSHE